MKYSIYVDNKCIAENARMANTFKDRMIGLMFSQDLGNSDALIIEPCNSIHTCFMRYPIDVLFISKNNQIVKVKKNMRPWRMTRMYWGASKVLEFMGGTLDEKVQDGMMVEFNNV